MPTVKAEKIPEKKLATKRVVVRDGDEDVAGYGANADL